MREQAERSLRNMRTDVIDLYYFHHCDFGPDDVYFDGALETMRRLRDEGKVRFIGLSDWDASRIMRFIERVDPDVVQPYRNLVDDGYESSGLKQWVDRHDLGVAFFSPLKHGLLLGKYDSRSSLPKATSAAASPTSATPKRSPATNALPQPCARNSVWNMPSPFCTPSSARSSPATPPPASSSANATPNRSPPRPRPVRR